ncbi:heteromeric transposase endonuclease subunit TnsA [Marinicella sp. S1101]|uniref:heteromeric transposase endonuclease subunit TnsA n=1 Tax=Marinicella marina TaxID=2996016 RepID=UPI002260D2CB|nr:heteromeric transposase endonuclease subunit TnsA [Marinicella marina]MCX7553083.1 heteromeric transposase endonuclease subunit TnsA [Marinicella marina]
MEKLPVGSPKRVIKAAYGSVTGFYPFKGQDSVQFESTLERDFLKRLETFDSVITVISQPVVIDYITAKGNPSTYTPDFRVVRKSYPYVLRPDCIVEVKPNKFLRKNFKELKPKFKAAIRYCKENGMVFHLMDEFKIKDTRWKNANFLRRYKKMNFEAEESEWIIRSLKLMGMTTFGRLLDHLYKSKDKRNIGKSHLWHLIANGRVYCDKSLPLDSFSELWVKS